MAKVTVNHSGDSSWTSIASNTVGGPGTVYNGTAVSQPVQSVHQALADPLPPGR